MIISKKYESYLKFIIVGFVNTVVDFLIFSLLIFLGTDKLIAQIFGYGFGIINSFVLNKIWTFKSNNRAVLSQMLKFLPVNLISLGISLIGLQIIAGYLNVNIFISKILVTILAQAINYFGYKLWVFAPESNNK